MSKLIIDIDVNDKNSEQKLKNIDENLKKIARDAANSGSIMDNSFKKAGASAGNFSEKVQGIFSGIGLGAIGGTAAIGMLGKQILDVTAKFEKFGIVLRNTLGDAAGTDALAMIANFAATTPFQLDEVTGAFIKMANQGFVPTREEMVKLGDLASSTGKSFDQLAEGILDAQTGEFERLKEFGIKASVAGDKVTFSFKEQKTTVDNSSKAIQAYILSLGELNGIAGANAKISESLTGQISNLGDKISAMYNEIGTANKGILYSAVGAASTLVENYKAIAETIGLLVGVYGAYRLAVMYVAREQEIMAAANLLVVESNGFLVASDARAIVMAERRAVAQNAVNASMLSNPYVVAAMGAVALGYAIYKLLTLETDLEKSQKALNSTIADTNKSIEAERLELDAMFGRLKAAKDGTDEYKAAKDAIFAKYGEQLKSLGNEKDALNDIALAYKTISEEALKSANARGMAKATGDAAKTASEVTGASRKEINKLLQEKFKGQTGNDGIGLAETYFAKIIPVIEGKEEMTAELEDILKQFDTTITTGGGGMFAQGIQVKYNPFREELKKIAKAKAEYDKTLEDAKVAFGESNTEKSTQTEINSQSEAKEKAAKQEKEDVKSVVEASKEYLAIQQQILDKTKELNEANKAGNTEKGIQLSKDIDALQKQISDLEKGKKIVPIKAKLQGGIDPKQDLKPMKQLTDEQTKQLNIQVKRVDKAKEEKDLEEEKARRQEDLLNYSRQFTGELIDQLGLTEQQTKVMQGMADVAYNMLSGNMLGAAFSAGSILISQIGGSKKEDATVKALENVNELLKQQSAILASMPGGGDYFNLAAKQVQSYNEAIKLNTQNIKNSSIVAQADIDRIQKRFDIDYEAGIRKVRTIVTRENFNDLIWKNSFTFPDQAKYKAWTPEQFVAAYADGSLALDQQQLTWIQGIVESQKQRSELLQDTFREALGFDASNVSDSILQGIEDGLKLGENSLGGFAESFGELMKTALKQSVIDSMELGVTQTFLPKYKEFMANDGTLIESERKELEGIYAKLVKQGEIDSANIKAITDPYLGSSGSSSQNSPSSAIAGASEETVSLVAGQMMAIRVDIKANQNIAMNQLNILDQCLSVQSQIEKNTRGISRLENIENSVNETNRILKEKL